jgi:hypothetical protein
MYRLHLSEREESVVIVRFQSRVFFRGAETTEQKVGALSAWFGSPWPESVSELYRPSDRRLSAKLLPNFADRGCHVVSVTDPYGRILRFLDRNFFFQAAPQLYSRG